MKQTLLILAMSSTVAYGQKKKDTTNLANKINWAKLLDTSKIRGARHVIMPAYRTENEIEDEVTYKSHKHDVIIQKKFSAYHCIKGNKQWYSIELNNDNDLIYTCRINVYKNKVIFFAFINNLSYDQFTELTNLINQCKEQLK